MFVPDEAPWAADPDVRVSGAERDAWWRDQDRILRERRAQLSSRALSAEERHRWLAEQQAMDHKRQTTRALEAARARLARLVRDWDGISRPDLGLGGMIPPDGPDGLGPHPDGLSPVDFDRPRR